MPYAVTPQKRMEELYALHARNPVSALIKCDADWKRFFSQRVEGGACYLVFGRTAVLWGDPLCAPADQATFLSEFAAAMGAVGLGVCVVPVSPGAADAAHAEGFHLLRLGADPTFDLRCWEPPRGNRGKNLRHALNRARRGGVFVDECTLEDGRVVADALLLLHRSWQAHRRGALGTSLLAGNLVAPEPNRRLFLAWSPRRVEAALACTYVPAADAWYLEDLIRQPDAVYGASELLIFETLQLLAREGAALASRGLVPTAAPEPHPSPRRLRWLVRGALLYLDRRYRFAQLARFDAKFGPTAWEPRFVGFAGPLRPLRLLAGAVGSLGA